MIEYNKFRNFLEDNGYSQEFNKEFERQHPGYHLNAVLWDILGGDEYFFARAFDWSVSPQGRDFWRDISDKWYCTATKQNV